VELAPITRDGARAFVAAHHRHSRPPTGWLFGVALMDAGAVVAVGMAGRPTARHLADGLTVEITRVCIGTPNAASRIYGGAARALGARPVTERRRFT
jgi:hypothetical protein